VKSFGAPHRYDLVPGHGNGPGALTVRPLTGRAGLRLEGEADLTGQHRLREALAALPPAAEIHLDLAGLDFTDIAATRQLIALTQQPLHSRLILHDPPPALLRLIRLLWPEANVEFDLSPGKIVDCDGEASGWRQKLSQAVGFVSHWPPRPATSCPR
jgi:anti-anti-sigma regulatory factor